MTSSWKQNKTMLHITGSWISQRVSDMESSSMTYHKHRGVILSTKTYIWLLWWILVEQTATSIKITASTHPHLPTPPLMTQVYIFIIKNGNKSINPAEVSNDICVDKYPQDDDYLITNLISHWSWFSEWFEREQLIFPHMVSRCWNQGRPSFQVHILTSRNQEI